LRDLLLFVERRKDESLEDLLGLSLIGEVKPDEGLSTRDQSMTSTLVQLPEKGTRARGAMGNTGKRRVSGSEQESASRRVRVGDY
jgi:hypothetical protein